MNSAQPKAAADDPRQAASLEQKVIAEVANRIGNLGVETADVAGNLDEISGRVARQVEQFKSLQRTAETMIETNRDLDKSARAAQTAASTAGAEVDESRTVVGAAVQHIGELTAAVSRIEERLKSFGSVLEQVAGVSSAIETIAKQTNLLALNATI
jgi:methyl-accepting chemotaxis protein